MENRSDDPCAIYASFSQNNITMSNNNTGKWPQSFKQRNKRRLRELPPQKYHGSEWAETSSWEVVRFYPIQCTLPLHSANRNLVVTSSIDRSFTKLIYFLEKKFIKENSRCHLPHWPTPSLRTGAVTIQPKWRLPRLSSLTTLHLR
jgi:hypothetical protein